MTEDIFKQMILFLNRTVMLTDAAYGEKAEGPEVWYK